VGKQYFCTKSLVPESGGGAGGSGGGLGGKGGGIGAGGGAGGCIVLKTCKHRQDVTTGKRMLRDVL